MKRRFAWGSLLWMIVCLILAAPFLVGGAEIRSPWKGALFIASAAFFAVSIWRAWYPRPEAADVVVSFTDTTITAKYSNGETRSVAWRDLSSVGVTTTDEGPMAEDVFWGLHAGDEVRVVYPSAADGVQDLLSAMQRRLPGFDNEALITAMGSTENNHFVVWRDAQADASAAEPQVEGTPWSASC